MKLTSIQLIAGVIPRHMNKTDVFVAGPGLELLPVENGSRRDVIVRRDGEEDLLIWQENIACGTLSHVDEAGSGVGAESDGAGSRSSAPSGAEAGSGVPATDSPPRKGKRTRKGGAS